MTRPGVSIRPRITVWAVVLLLVGCGGATASDPEIIVNGDDCSYEGSSELPAGEATVVLQLRNLGHSAVSVVRLDGAEGYAALVDHYAGGTQPVLDPPAWASEVVRLEVEQDGGEAKGVSNTITLTEGSYGVICIDHWGFAADGPASFAVAEVTVGAADAP